LQFFLHAQLTTSWGLLRKKSVNGLGWAWTNYQQFTAQFVAAVLTRELAKRQLPENGERVGDPNATSLAR
jgi:hypothetical protein